jgi:hypothetical protein
MIHKLSDMIGTPDVTTQDNLGRIVRAVPLPFRGGIVDRARDAWAVFRGDVFAVRWPEAGELERTLNPYADYKVGNSDEDQGSGVRRPIARGRRRRDAPRRRRLMPGDTFIDREACDLWWVFEADGTTARFVISEYVETIQALEVRIDGAPPAAGYRLWPIGSLPSCTVAFDEPPPAASKVKILLRARKVGISNSG